MIVVETLIVPGASWPSTTRNNEARKASLNVLLASFEILCEVRSNNPELIVDTLSVVSETICSD